jgi:hypothetical protein
MAPSPRYARARGKIHCPHGNDRTSATKRQRRSHAPSSNDDGHRYQRAGRPGCAGRRGAADPIPADDEILVAVAAAGVNRPDVMQREGKYPPPPGAPDIPGLEISGVVARTGRDVSRWREGDQVVALVPGGGYAEFCTVHESNALPLPKPLTLVEGRGLPETTFTVWHNVFQRGGLRPGEWLLVHGGSSGIGTTAIQLAKAFRGPGDRHRRLRREMRRGQAARRRRHGQLQADGFRRGRSPRPPAAAAPT